jgi:hypothetical protein
MLKRFEKTTAYLGYLAQIKIFPQKEIKHLLTWVIIILSGKLRLHLRHRLLTNTVKTFSNKSQRTGLKYSETNW